MEKRVFVSSTTNKRLGRARRSSRPPSLLRFASSLRAAGVLGIRNSRKIAWSFENANRVMQKCVGAVVFGFPRWTISEEGGEMGLAGEYNHYEGAVALTHGLPVLLLAERGIDNRGVFWTGGGKTITRVPRGIPMRDGQGPDFTKRFQAWARKLASAKDVFLGYCSKSAGIASQFSFDLRAWRSVLNWAMDFRAGGSILSEIENARAGLFLVECFCSARTIPSKVRLAELHLETMSCLRLVIS